MCSPVCVCRADHQITWTNGAIGPVAVGALTLLAAVVGVAGGVFAGAATSVLGAAV
jgi:hypothetical protein